MTGMADFPARHPDSQECRMLRALFDEVLRTAALHGFERVSFHGYRIEGRSLYAASARHARVMLTLHDEGGATLLDAVRIAVARPSRPGSACVISHPRAPVLAALEAESLAGCVSPEDARDASPETGPIS